MSEQPSVESSVLEHSKWVLYSVQILGYTPLSAVKGRLTFRWKSIPVIYCLILIFLSVTWHALFLTEYRPLFAIFERGPTESFANYLMASVISFSGIILKICGLVHAKVFLKFWQGTMVHIENLRRNACTYGTSHSKDHSKMCKAAKKKTRNLVLFNALVAFLHTFYNFGLCLFTDGYYCQYALQDRVPNGFYKSTYYLGQSLWTLMLVLHSGQSVWMQFFIKIYKIEFMSIFNEIKNIINEVEKTSYSSVDVFLTNFKPGHNISTNKNDWNSYRVSIDARYPYADVENDKILSIPSAKRSSFDVGVKRSPRITPEQEERLNKCLESFLSVEEQVDAFNCHFGVKLILEMAICISIILTYSFFAMLFISRSQYKSLLSIIGPFTIFLGELVCLADSSTSMTSQAKAILRQMQSLPFINLTQETQMKVQMLAIRLASNPPVITGSNYFTLNKTVVTSTISAITTYLIVLFQFQRDS